MEIFNSLVVRTFIEAAVEVVELVVVEDGDVWLDGTDDAVPDARQLKSGVFMCSWVRLFVAVVVDVGTEEDEEEEEEVDVLEANCCLEKSGILA